MYIFIDESGDLGSGKGSSRCFVLAALIVLDPRPVERPIKSLRRSLRKRGKSIGEFHAHRTKPRLVRKLLLGLRKIPDLEIAFVVFQKQGKLSSEDQKGVYSQLSQSLIFGVCKKTLLPLQSLSIVFDKRYDDNFSENLSKIIVGELVDLYQVKPGVVFMSSESSKSLQATDFVSWSVFQNVETQENAYFDLLVKNVVLNSVIKTKTPLL